MPPNQPGLFRVPREGEEDDADSTGGARLIRTRRSAERVECYTGIADWVQIIQIAHDMCNEWGFRPSAGELERMGFAALDEAAKSPGPLKRISSARATDEILLYLPWVQFTYTVSKLFDQGRPQHAHSILATPLFWFLARQEPGSPHVDSLRSQLVGEWRQRIASMPAFHQACEEALNALRNALERHVDRRPEPHEAKAIAAQVAHRFSARLRAGPTNSQVADQVVELLALVARHGAFSSSESQGLVEKFDSAAFFRAQHSKCVLRADIAKRVAAVLPPRWRNYALEAWGNRRSQQIRSEADAQGLNDGTLRRYAHEMRMYLDSASFHRKLDHIATGMGLCPAAVVDLLSTQPLCPPCAQEEAPKSAR